MKPDEFVVMRGHVGVDRETMIESALSAIGSDGRMTIRLLKHSVGIGKQFLRAELEGHEAIVICERPRRDEMRLRAVATRIIEIPSGTAEDVLQATSDIANGRGRSQD